MITPYKQAYIVTLKSGRVVLAVIEATNRALGELAAKEAAIAIEPAAEFWAIAAYPTSPELPLQVTTLAAFMPMGDAVKAAQAAIDAHNGAMRLEEGSGPAVDLWHLVLSLIEWSASNDVNFDAQVSAAKIYLESEGRNND